MGETLRRQNKHDHGCPWYRRTVETRKYPTKQGINAMSSACCGNSDVETGRSCTAVSLLAIPETSIESLDLSWLHRWSQEVLNRIIYYFVRNRDSGIISAQILSTREWPHRVSVRGFQSSQGSMTSRDPPTDLLFVQTLDREPPESRAGKTNRP